jgi:HemY protein
VLRRRAHREILRDMSSVGDDGAALARYLRDMDEADRQDSAVANALAKALLSAGSTGEAARIIEESLDEQWDSELVNIYGQVEGGDVLGRLSHAERWLAQHPRDARLLLALGRLCRQRSLWGKAQSYLEASLAVAPSRECHVELARLLDYLEKPEDANRHYRAAALTACA